MVIEFISSKNSRNIKLNMAKNKCVKIKAFVITSEISNGNCIAVQCITQNATEITKICKRNNMKTQTEAVS